MAEYYFKLPQITDLKTPQQSALYETQQIALSGGPGTGKSVVSLWRHINNLRNKKNSLLLTYTTTLKMYFIGACKNEAKKTDIQADVKDAFNKATQNIKTSLSGRPNSSHNLFEVIIDEAQDLPISYYQGLKRVISKVSYGADKSQILYPEQSSDPDKLKEIFSENIDYVLDENFRSTQRILLLAKALFSEAYIPKSTIDKLGSNIGELPVLLISESNRWNEIDRRYEISNEKQDNSIINIINTFQSGTNNIAVLVPWKKNAIYFESLFKKNNVSNFSIYYEDDLRFPHGAEEIQNVHITTFKSSKGLEFDTVIIPNFYSISKINANLVISGITNSNKENLQNLLNQELKITKSIPSNKSSINIQAKESKIKVIKEVVEKVDGINLRVDFTWKDLYVAITRTRSNLYMITQERMPELEKITDQTPIDNMLSNNINNNDLPF